MKQKGSMPQNRDGQPVSERLRAAAVQTRNVNELIGICRGIVFDDTVNQAEMASLLAWLHSQPDLIQVWPANVLYQRLVEVFADEVMDADEAADLLAMLKEVVGGNPAIQESVDTGTGEILAEVSSTALPVTTPEVIEFAGRNFVLTGKFASGSRKECQAEIILRGGVCQSNPTQVTHYLVVGSIGSRDWIQSSWGRKIEKAVELRASGRPIEIVAEEFWVQWLN